ncbi:hypothetical protein K443DRAFT_680914 [Laccaria amethystina LaAM-08-1]|uniref:Uncharacterized protein n=1 Tax=Laccaria amethystina LaAM-08-1 TaxID=1095629 RepID=A0A0C9XKT3_9AGAR|nr:hypothetical protein K443DRAFT_680914 [Laccaria amethystina LaAM-08-1]
MTTLLYPGLSCLDETAHYSQTLTSWASSSPPLRERILAIVPASYFLPAVKAWVNQHPHENSEL